MREIRLSASEGGGAVTLSLHLSPKLSQHPKLGQASLLVLQGRFMVRASFSLTIPIV